MHWQCQNFFFWEMHLCKTYGAVIISCVAFTRNLIFPEEKRVGGGEGGGKKKKDVGFIFISGRARLHKKKNGKKKIMRRKTDGRIPDCLPKQAVLFFHSEQKKTSFYLILLFSPSFFLIKDSIQLHLFFHKHGMPAKGGGGGGGGGGGASRGGSRGRRVKAPSQGRNIFHLRSSHMEEHFSCLLANHRQYDLLGAAELFIHFFLLMVFVNDLLVLWQGCHIER